MTPKQLARTAGALSLLVLFGGIVAQGVIADGMVVQGDAVATAARIAAQPKLWTLGLTVYLFEMAAEVAAAAVFYVLLRPVDRTVALLSLVFELVGATIKTMARGFYLAPLFVLDGADYLKVFSESQLPALAYLFIRINNNIAGIALVFLGIATFFQGYLIAKSTFLPRVLGVIAMIGGLGWTTYAYPALGSALFYYVVIVAVVGVLLTSGWLLVRGVDEERWRAQAQI